MCVQNIMYNYIGDNQFSYKKGRNSTMALKKWSRVISFDFIKAFDNVPHDILFKKIKKIPINPYIIFFVIYILYLLASILVHGLLEDHFRPCK